MSSCESLTQKVTPLLEAEKPAVDLSSIQAGLDEINARLARLEATVQNSQSKISNLKSIHPSQDRFAVAEAIADAIFDQHNKEKACAFEPNGKPCDHCAMCSSRGF